MLHIYIYDVSHLRVNVVVCALLLSPASFRRSYQFRTKKKKSVHVMVFTKVSANVILQSVESRDQTRKTV